MIIKFKGDVNPDDWNRIHPDVKHVFETLAFLFDRIGYDLEITSMIRPHILDTGIHAKGRAIDCVPRKTENSRVFVDPAMCQKICVFLGLLYRRPSTFPIAIYHDAGTGFHFHLQVDEKNLYVKSDQPWKDIA